MLPMSPHPPPAAPSVVVPSHSFPPCCRGWGQPREMLAIVTQAAAPTSVTVMECELEGPTRVSKSNSWLCYNPQQSHLACSMLGFFGGNQERPSEGFGAPHSCPFAAQKGRCPEAPGCSSFILQYQESTVRKGSALLEPLAEGTDMATGGSPSSICAPRMGISALGLSCLQSQAYALGDFFYQQPAHGWDEPHLSWSRVSLCPKPTL